ncbi:MAG: HTH domain-containing protein [Rhodospirillales bacterium]|nr:HTH domain-containing protein [Rhodospirillales bacterium]
MIISSKNQRSIPDTHTGNGIENPQNDDTINDTINLNERQKWFLLRLKNDRNKTAEDIVRHFSVSLSTAKRDIAELKKWEAIRFHGSRKTGYYEVIDNFLMLK